MKLFIVEGNQLKLVYEYMDNNCLSRALFELISSIHHKHFFYSSKIKCFLSSIIYSEVKDARCRGVDRESYESFTDV